MNHTRTDLETICAFFDNVQWTVQPVGNVWQAIGISRFAPQDRPHLRCLITAVPFGQDKCAWEILMVGMPVCWGTRSYPDDTAKKFVERFLNKAPTANWKVRNE